MWHYPSLCSSAISVDVIKKYPDNKQFRGRGIYFNTQFQVRIHHCRKTKAGTCTRIGRSREKGAHACCLFVLWLFSPLLNSSGPPPREWWPSPWAFHISNIIKTIPHKHVHCQPSDNPLPEKFFPGGYPLCQANIIPPKELSILKCQQYLSWSRNFGLGRDSCGAVHMFQGAIARRKP